MNGRRVVWPRPETAQIEDFVVGEPEPGQVLIETELTLVSPGTERAHLSRLPNTPGNFPMYPGYSNVGRILKVGPGVEGFAPGDRVVSYSAHASHVLQDPDWIVRLPDGLSPERAVFACLGAVVLQGVRKAAIDLAECVTVIGQGLLGLLADQLCRLSGALPVVAADVREEPLATALRLGADQAVLLPRESFPFAPSVVIEVTGSPQAILEALRICRPSGRIVLLGSSRGITEQVDFYSTVHRKGLVLLGAHDWVRPKSGRSPHWWSWEEDINAVLELIRAGRLNVDDLLTSRVASERAPEMYEELLAGVMGKGIIISWKR